MKISDSFCLSSFNKEPSYFDRVISTVDNYFYFGGRQIEIIARNEATRELICLSNPGRSVSTAEKVVKILSYLIFPIVLIALLIRFLLHKVLHKNHKIILIDRQDPCTPCALYLKDAIAMRDTFMKIRFTQPNNDILRTTLNQQGLKIVHFYQDSTSSQLLITMTSTRFPDIAFTFVVPSSSITTSKPEDIQWALMEHLWNCTKAINVAKQQNLNHLIISNPIGMSLQDGVIIHHTRNGLLKDKSLSKKETSSSIKDHNILQKGLNDLTKFTVISGYPGKVFARSQRNFICVNNIKDIYKILIIDPGNTFPVCLDKDSEAENRVSALMPILKNTPPEYLKGMLNQIPNSIKSKIKNIHSLLSKEFLDNTLDLKAPIFMTDSTQSQISNHDKRLLVTNFLRFISQRASVQNDSGRDMVVFYKHGQSYPGGGTGILIDQLNNYGSMFYKPEGIQEKCLGESIMDQLVNVGIFSKYNNTDTMVCAYFD
ncbi:DUF648 domain-containing protein [Chlamydia sp. 12-01]|uniref:DUF648 domain-containing protein n=1 Tax=Chlamydia sp. 12-01 TaxID=3002742 RepID=UPI0035D4B836